MGSCPPDSALDAFAEARLPPANAAAVRDHLLRCSACKARVDAAADDATAGEWNEPTEPGNVAPAPAPPPVAPIPRIVIRDGKVRRTEADAPPTGAARTIAADGGPAPASRAILGPGTIIGERYELVRPLGEGGTGVVWEANHLVMRRRVALKVLKSKDPQARRRFEREARVTAALRHPNIVEVYDVFVVPGAGMPVIVMEILEGAPLERWTGGGTRLALGDVARVLVQVVAALRAAHDAGVVHRDLKPENVFLVGGPPSLESPRVKVLDFGLAKVTATEGALAETSALTKGGFLLGTPHYMAPEQITGDHPIGVSTDVWALGILLFETLAGARPFDGPTLASLFPAILEAEVPSLASRADGLPSDVADLTDRMLSRTPEDRPSLDEVERVLAAHA